MATIIKARWEWGDGAISTAILPTVHVYKAPGVYTVRRTVWYDNGGTSSYEYPNEILVLDSEDYCEKPLVKVYRVGDNLSDGFGVSEIGGPHFPVQKLSVNPLTIQDDNGTMKIVLYDTQDRQLYNIAATNGPVGSNSEFVWRDKADQHGEGGFVYDSYMNMRSIKGELEAFFIENVSTNLYTEPEPLSRRNVDVYNYTNEGYPEELSVSVGVKTKDVDEDFDVMERYISLPKHEITYDRRVEGNYLQATIRWNTAPIVIKGLSYNVLRKDRLDTPEARQMSSTAFQGLLAETSFWLSRQGNLNIDRVSGRPVSTLGSWGAKQGPDGKMTDTAIQFSGNIQLSIGTVLLWYHQDTEASSFPVDVHRVATHGEWVCGYLEITGLPNVLGPGKYFDIRQLGPGTYPEELFKYYADDVKFNGGDAVMPAVI